MLANLPIRKYRKQTQHPPCCYRSTVLPIHKELKCYKQHHFQAARFSVRHISWKDTDGCFLYQLSACYRNDHVLPVCKSVRHTSRLDFNYVCQAFFFKFSIISNGWIRWRICCCQPKTHPSPCCMWQRFQEHVHRLQTSNGSVQWGETKTTQLKTACFSPLFCKKKHNSAQDRMLQSAILLDCRPVAYHFKKCMSTRAKLIC